MVTHFLLVIKLTCLPAAVKVEGVVAPMVAKQKRRRKPRASEGGYDDGAASEG
jgi:hypothetical protein